MKKCCIVALSIMTCLVLSVGIFTACTTRTDDPQAYTIAFYDDDMLVNTIETAGNEEIALPAAPQKEGLTFGGWYLDKDVWRDKLTKDSFSDRALTENINAYAYYIQNDTPLPSEYTITFYADGGVVDTIETAGNETLVLPAAPQKEGLTFDGWYLDKDVWRDKLTKDSFSDRALTENINAYAYYIQNDTPLPSEYTITFYADGGVVDTIETAGNETLVLPAAPNKDDHSFEGWFFDSGTWQNELTETTYAYKPLTEDVGVYAYYKKTEGPDPEPEPPQKYTVQFNTDGGTAVGDMTVSVIDTPPVTARKGYTFDGWYTEATFVKRVTFPYKVTKAQTLYAKWTKNGPEEIVFSVDSNGVLTSVSGLTASNTTVVIPSEVGGITVREIGTGVFKDNRNIVSLTIPDSVTTLQNRICSGCTALREVYLPSGLTVIPDETFDGCSSLSTVHFPDTLEQIRSDAFCGTALTEFIAPDSLTEIWSYAFKDCSGLVKVDLKNVSSVSGGAFQSCTALRSVRLSDKLTELPDHLFDGCTSLAEIDMPDNPIAVSSFILNGTAYYNDQSNWDGGVLYADGYLIAADKTFASLTEYTVKADTLVIADNAFSGVGYTAKLKKMTLPDDLYRIGQSAFSKLYSLTEINIPDSVRSVGYGAFSASGYDTEQNYTGGGLYVGNWLVAVQNDAMTSFTVREGTVGVADGKDTALFPTIAQKITQLTLPSSLKYIGARSFARLHITDLELPSGLQTLGEGAFSSCSWLKTVNLGECTELESIGAQAFTSAAISEITIPENVASMGELVFNHNTVGLTIHCEVSEQPEDWHKDWAYSDSQGVTITVEWKNA